MLQYDSDDHFGSDDLELQLLPGTINPLLSHM